MAGKIVITSMDQFSKYLDKDGCFEIVTRDKKKKYKDFIKVILNNAPQGEEKKLVDKAIDSMNRNNVLLDKSSKMMNNVAKLQSLNAILGATNLCATCAGFAILAKNLDKMSGQIGQLLGTLKQGNEVRTDYEYKKIISEYANMLDARKTQKYYTEEQMRKLVDDEYNVLNLLMDVFRKDLAENNENLILSIYTMASMLAVSMRHFDELYYFNNREVIGDGDVWHSSHDNWMTVFDDLVSDEIMEKIQDHAVFELGYSMFDADAYYLNLKDQVKDMIESIQDNQELIIEFGNEEVMKAYDEYINQEVSDEIKKAFEETEGALENPEVAKAYQDTMKQLALAY